MATKGVNPFARFQKPGKDKDKGMKEGSKMKHGGTTKMAMGGMPKMAKGGGIESKGKTKGTMVRMKNGGKAC